MDIESLVRGILTENKQFRARTEMLASRTVSAIVRNTPDEFSDIIRDATGGDTELTDREDSEGGSESVET